MDRKQLIACLKFLELSRQDPKDKGILYSIEPKDEYEQVINVEMPHKSRIHFGMKSGMYLSANRFTIKGEFLFCQAPRDIKSVFPIEFIESVHNALPTKPQE